MISCLCVPCCIIRPFPSPPSQLVLRGRLGGSMPSHHLWPSAAGCHPPVDRGSPRTKVCHDDSALSSSSKRSCRPRSLADLAMCMCSPMWLGLRQHPSKTPAAGLSPLFLQVQILLDLTV
ncbi:hypothetical protein NW759_000270 [Fusarium solani]|nr:hypothetical protein NW759_000270 [Fusarium solani]